MKSSNSSSVGIVSWDFDPPKGGLGRALQNIANTLRTKGKKVAVYTSTVRLGGHLLFSFFLVWKLNAWVRRHGIQTILLPVGPGGVFLFRKPKNCKVVAIVYHTYMQQATAVPGQWWKRVFIPWEKNAVRKADHIFTYTPEAQALLIDTYRLPVSRVHLLPQLLNIHEWHSSITQAKDTKLCVCIARLEARKGVEVLLHAWERIQSEVPEAKLCIVGDGILRSRIDRTIHSLGNSVERISSLSQQELRSLVQRASVLIAPSYLEGFGLAVAEAMMAGTAVVASNVDGHSSLLSHEQTGLLFPAGNSDALSDHVVRLLHDPHLRSNLSSQAQTSIQQRFTKEQAETALLDAIDSI